MNPPLQPEPDELDEILSRLEGNITSDVVDAMNHRPMARTFGVDDNPRGQAKQAIQQLMHKAVVEELETLFSSTTSIPLSQILNDRIAQLQSKPEEGE